MLINFKMVTGHSSGADKFRKKILAYTWT